MQARWRVWVMVSGAAVGVALADPAPAQSWKRERNVELTIPTSPGGSNDIAFKGAADTRKWLDEEATALKATMTDLGLVK
ncbi:MAG TPA: hypothetical protein VFC14_19155 [Burkholderiales bacterium]|nr:hypothetical protein [Burkholderiales bacterium]